jgi:hypothetical protein
MEKQKKALEVLKSQFNFITLLSCIYGGLVNYWILSNVENICIRIFSGLLYTVIIIITLIHIVWYVKNSIIHSSISDRKLLDLFKQKGFDGIMEEREQNHSAVINKLREAEKSIKIIAYFGEIALNGLKSELIIKLNKETDFDVKILTSTGNSDLIDEVQDLEGTAKNSKKHIDVINCITEIKEKTTNKNPRIQVGHYNTQIRYAAIIIDENWAWWTPYHPGLTTEECISFELADKRNDSIIHLCNKHFKMLWDQLEKEGKIVKY